MTEAELLKLIEDGENIRVEFKKSTTEITKDVYDTVCSFPTETVESFSWASKTTGRFWVLPRMRLTV